MEFGLFIMVTTQSMREPPGFWEVVLNAPNIGITLQQLTELDGGLIIDKGFSNRTFSFFE